MITNWCSLTDSLPEAFDDFNPLDNACALQVKAQRPLKEHLRSFSKRLASDHDQKTVIRSHVICGLERYTSSLGLNVTNYYNGIIFCTFIALNPCQADSKAQQQNPIHHSIAVALYNTIPLNISPFYTQENGHIIGNYCIWILKYIVVVNQFTPVYLFTPTLNFLKDS